MRWIRLFVLSLLCPLALSAGNRIFSPQDFLSPAVMRLHTDDILQIAFIAADLFSYFECLTAYAYTVFNREISVDSRQDFTIAQDLFFSGQSVVILKERRR